MAANKVVMIVEDDTFLSQLLSNRLTRDGLTIIRAGDGQEALDILKDTKPDLILLDLILPKKSGFEVMEEIQKNPLLKRAPVVIISNLGQDDDISRGKQLGAIEYYVKAKISIEDLVNKIQDLLSSQPK
jgi:two-component system phosphate regulon response regulator PhoB/two-component system alkaline phosphatase synthesis response regulator PhoP